MLAVYAECLVKAEKIAQFLEIANELSTRSLQDTGCLSYHFGRVLDKENTFAFVEIWQSQADLDKHLSEPHFQQAKTQFADVLADELTINIVEIHQ